MTALEGMMMDVRRELQAVRNGMHNVFMAANIASEESQQVALRMDNMEYKWHLWNDGQDYDASPQGQQPALDDGVVEQGSLPTTPRLQEPA